MKYERFRSDRKNASLREGLGQVPHFHFLESVKKNR